MAGITGFSAISGTHFPDTANVASTAPAPTPPINTAPVASAPTDSDNTNGAVYSAVTSASASTLRGGTVDITA